MTRHRKLTYTVIFYISVYTFYICQAMVDTVIEITIMRHFLLGLLAGIRYLTYKLIMQD